MESVRAFAPKTKFINVMKNLFKTRVTKALFALSLIPSSLLFSNSAFADVYVKGHYRSNGSYVKPHYRSSPNNTTLDNWSYSGNRNPYTGSYGSKNSNFGYGTGDFTPNYGFSPF